MLPKVQGQALSRGRKLGLRDDQMTLALTPHLAAFGTSQSSRPVWIPGLHCSGAPDCVGACVCHTQGEAPHAIKSAFLEGRGLWRIVGSGKCLPKFPEGLTYFRTFPLPMACAERSAVPTLCPAVLFSQYPGLDGEGPAGSLRPPHSHMQPPFLRGAGQVLQTLLSPYMHSAVDRGLKKEAFPSLH